MESQISKEGAKDLFRKLVFDWPSKCQQIYRTHLILCKLEKLYISFPPHLPPRLSFTVSWSVSCVSGYIFPLTIPNSRKLGPQLESSAHQVFLMPFNSCKLSTANFHLYITWWEWRQSSLNTITTIILDPEKETHLFITTFRPELNMPLPGPHTLVAPSLAVSFYCMGHL